MLSQADIDRRIDEILAGPMPPMQVSFLDPDLAGQEQFIILCRGSRRDFTDVIHFWLKARQRCEWWDRWGDGDGFGNEYENYGAYAAHRVKSDEPLTYSPLSRDEFYSWINSYPVFGRLSQPLSEVLGLETIVETYISGVSSTVSDPIGSAALAQFEHEFVAFHWECTG